MKIIGCTSWQPLNQHVVVDTGRIIATGSTFRGGPTGIAVNSAADPCTIVGNDFDGVATPIALNGPNGLGTHQIGPNTVVNGSDPNVGDRRVFSNQYAASTAYRYASDVGAFTYVAAKARGSYKAPAAIAQSDSALAMQALGYDGSTFGILASQRVTSRTNPTAGSLSGAWVWSTTKSSASPIDRWLLNEDGNLSPIVDNTYSLGASGLRVSAVWAANGVIQTSDERLKQDVVDETLGLDFINSLRPVSYRWKVGGTDVVRQAFNDVEGNEISEGEPIPDTATPGRMITLDRQGQRVFHGLLSQEVKAAIDKTGIDFAGWVLTDKDDPESQQALRYDQFIAPLIKAIQELSAQVEVLKSDKS